jgi:hypothetical protein
MPVNSEGSSDVDFEGDDEESTTQGDIESDSPPCVVCVHTQCYLFIYL